MPTKQTGMTLVELIVSIVILGFVGISLMIIMTNTSLQSAKPMIDVQAAIIGKAYMEEILSKSYSDPDGASETTRDEFDDVEDYSGTDTGVKDRLGNSITELSGYTVTYSVEHQANCSDIADITSACKKIKLSVKHQSQSNSLPFVAYKFY